MEREPGRKFSDVYGVEHFLRMFIKLPPLLAQIGASEEELRGLRAKLQDMLKFLQRKKDRFLSSTAYVKASLPYVQAFERNLGGATSSTSTPTAPSGTEAAAGAGAGAATSAAVAATATAAAAAVSTSAPETEPDASDRAMAPAVDSIASDAIMSAS
jgi:hypothetical protein